MLATIRTRILRHLERQGLLDSDHGDHDSLHDEAPLLASCYASSIGGRQTLGPRRGAKLQRIGADPNAPSRRMPRGDHAVVAYGRGHTGIGATNEVTDAALPARAQLPDPTPPRAESRQWADLMRSSFGHDLLACAQCGGKMKLLDVVLERSAIRRILTHLRLPSDPRAAAPARAPPDF